VALRAAGPLVFPIDNKGVETVPTLSLVLPVAVWPDRADRVNLERALQMHPDAGVDVPGIEVVAVRQDPPVLKGLMEVMARSGTVAEVVATWTTRRGASSSQVSVRWTL
jgi:hypothetical protein